MDRESLTVILAQVLTSDEKWQNEVERNVMLQKTIDELFSDSVFHVLLENQMLPKKGDTALPHFRAIELICTVRELAVQIAEGALNASGIKRELEELNFKLCDKHNASDSFALELSYDETMVEVERFAGLYRTEPQFAARVDRFRLVLVPLCFGGGESSSRCQLVLMENTRSPRSAWRRK